MCVSVCVCVCVCVHAHSHACIPVYVFAHCFPLYNGDLRTFISLGSVIPMNIILESYKTLRSSVQSG